MNPRAVGIVAAGLAIVVCLGVGVAWYFGLIFSNPTGSGAPVAVPSGAVTTVASNLAAPWGNAFLPDGTALVTERDTTRILSVAPDGKVTEVQRVAEADPGGEGGLLGIAVSPNYARDSFVYIYYTASEDNRIARLRLARRLNPSSPESQRRAITTVAGSHSAPMACSTPARATLANGDAPRTGTSSAARSCG